MEENKEILYLLDIAINSYIENDILRLDVSDTTKNRLKRDLRKKFRDEDFIYDIKNNIGLISKSKVKEILNKEKLPLTIVGGRRNAKTLEYGRKLGRIEVCKELLGKE